ncbi:carbohydrate ABC transporter permease [Paenibacillus sp.]|uniref:carbohydrate ABC transporter permease n=1 Tax=Paenibacillus sp. TaxID=58172 RepID=UPI0028117A9D|nr:carbohydrate ABC transporter permease [Paenibacillus sp.]
MKQAKIWKNRQEIAFEASVYTFLALFAAVCVLPFWLVVMNSFASERNINVNGFEIVPNEFSLLAYEFLFAGEQLFRSYGVTLFVTAVGTSLAVLVSAAYAYVLAHPKIRIRGLLGFLTYFTMIFGAGLVGFYITVGKVLNLHDSIWALIFPYLLNPFYAFILVSYFRSLPFELNEAATIDGANEMTIFFRMIWPVSLPVIATVALFYALAYWNDWYLALLFIDNPDLHPLQIMIRQLLSNINAQSYIGGNAMSYAVAVPSTGLQLATVCVTIGPIVLLYPMLQKYYVKGIMLGSVKG